MKDYSLKTVVNSITPEDYDAWIKLWDANNLGQKNDDVTTMTWHRLLNAASPVSGFLARLDGKVVGLVHYILHAVTEHIEPVAYMEDLYVDPSYRRRGIGKALVEAVAAKGKNEGWARLYWLAEEKNVEAQALYLKMGVQLDFSLHVLPLKECLL